MSIDSLHETLSDIHEDDKSLAITVEYVQDGLDSTSRYLEMSEEERIESDRLRDLGASILAIIRSETADQTIDPSPGVLLETLSAGESSKPRTESELQEQRVAKALIAMGQNAELAQYQVIQSGTDGLPMVPVVNRNPYAFAGVAKH